MARSWSCARGAGPAVVHVAGVMPGGGVPQDGEALAGQGERDGAVHRGGEPTARLPGTEDLLGVRDRHFYAPAARVPLDELNRSHIEVGGG